jgi:hypothetical protein
MAVELILSKEPRIIPKQDNCVKSIEIETEQPGELIVFPRMQVEKAMP